MFHVYFFSSLLLYKHLGIARGTEGEKERIPLSHSYSMYSAGDEHEKNTGKTFNTLIEYLERNYRWIRDSHLFLPPTVKILLVRIRHCIAIRQNSPQSVGLDNYCWTS